MLKEFEKYDDVKALRNWLLNTFFPIMKEDFEKAAQTFERNYKIAEARQKSITRKKRKRLVKTNREKSQSGARKRITWQPLEIETLCKRTLKYLYFVKMFPEL